jgi:16S rRNA processing protein RimM
MAKKKGSGSRRRPEPEFLNVARVLRPWGVRGEMKVELLSSHAEDFAPGQRVYASEDRSFEVLSARAQRGRWIIKLAGYDTPEQAEALRDVVLRIPRQAAAPLRPNEYYHEQIIGLSVVTVDGETLGQVTEILATGANDVYVVTGSRGEVLLPARAEVVRSVDLAAGRMIVSLLPGLLPE